MSKIAEKSDPEKVERSGDVVWWKSNLFYIFQLSEITCCLYNFGHEKTTFVKELLKTNFVVTSFDKKQCCLAQTCRYLYK